MQEQKSFDCVTATWVVITIMTPNVPVCVAINKKKKFFFRLATSHYANLLNTLVVNSFDHEEQVSLMPKVEFDRTSQIVLEAPFLLFFP